MQMNDECFESIMHDSSIEIEIDMEIDRKIHFYSAQRGKNKK